MSLCLSAKACTCGPRITEPSSFINSESTPTAGRPASRQRSTQASVWPERMSTPPCRATSGKTWPGRTKSLAPLLSLASARTVLVRSSAEMPVVSPWRTSTVTVKAVPSGASFSATIGSRCSLRARSPPSGAQTMPEVWRMMKAIFSGVHSEAATKRSPSFSRSSSSVTTTISPLAKALIAASTLAWVSDTSVSNFFRHSGTQAKRADPESILRSARGYRFRARGLRPRPGMTDSMSFLLERPGYPLADLRAVHQIVVGEHARHHCLADRHGADADAGVVAAFGHDVGVVAIAVDGLARRQDRRGRLDGETGDD